MCLPRCPAASQHPCPGLPLLTCSLMAQRDMASQYLMQGGEGKGGQERRKEGQARTTAAPRKEGDRGGRRGGRSGGGVWVLEGMAGW